MNANNSVYGLESGNKAPSVETVDVFENKINSSIILQNHRGLLIDFIRGAW